MTSPRLVHGIDLTAPDGITRLLAHRRARHGNTTMTAGTGEQQQPGQPPAGTAGGDPTGGTPVGGQGPAGGDTGTPSKDDGPKFTQADLDRIVNDRVTAEQAKAQKALEEAQALAGKNETEKLTIERDQANARATEAQTKAAERIAKTEAKVAAIAAGANPERVAAIVRNADLGKAVKDGEVDEAAVKAAIDKVLTDYPEWKKAAGSGPSASGGELNGGAGDQKPRFTRKQLEEMPPEEMARRIDEVNEAIADGRVTG